MDTFDKIIYCIKKNPNGVNYYDDAYLYIKGQFNRDVLTAMRQSKELKKLCVKAEKNITVLSNAKKEIRQIVFKLLVLETPYSLDSYFQALEFNRPINEQFYRPRRQQLLDIVHALEDLVIWDKIDELFLSQPPRTGKTTLVLFLITWKLGVMPEASNLYGSFSGNVASAFYRGVMEIITDEYTYNWAKIFPNAKFDPKSYCNSKETYLDVGRIKRYHSFTARSIDGSLNGACDCSGILIGDDLVSGFEEAVNQVRLATVWSKVENDFTTRAKENAKILWIGTRWSINDPIGRRIKVLTEEPAFKTRRYRIINKPALDENGESNFQYDYDVGFSKTFYEQKRASFENTGDMASWEAQFMGSPIERSGQLFSAESLMYFNSELPPNKIPSKIIAPCDVAWGGGDAVSCPVMYVYKDEFNKNNYDVYVPAVVFDYGDKQRTQPRIAKLCIKWAVQQLQFERNSRGDEYGEDVNEILKENNYPISITTKSAPTTISKDGRIIQASSDIKLHFHFLSAPYRDKDYNMFMQNLFGYSANGGTKQKDDAPDSLAQGVDMLRTPQNTTAEYTIFRRPF
jgi:hypothetical protein